MVVLSFLLVPWCRRISCYPWFLIYWCHLCLRVCFCPFDLFCVFMLGVCGVCYGRCNKVLQEIVSFCMYVLAVRLMLFSDGQNRDRFFLIPCSYSYFFVTCWYLIFNVCHFFYIWQLKILESRCKNSRILCLPGNERKNLFALNSYISTLSFKWKILK